jgi:hypothetical protein
MRASCLLPPIRTCAAAARRFMRADGGQTLRHYLVAVATAALVVIVVLTLFAERIYLAVIETFGPT